MKWPQNSDELVESGPIRLMRKSSNPSLKVPSKVKPPCLAPSSSVAVEVAPGEGFAPPLVPSHLWVPPDGVVTSWPSVVTGFSYSVPVLPSTRSFTDTGSAWAAGARDRQGGERTQERAAMGHGLPFLRGID